MTTKKSALPTVIEFLKESNAIEGVFDEYSLQQAQKAWEFLSIQKELNTATILETHRILAFGSHFKLIMKLALLENVKYGLVEEKG